MTIKFRMMASLSDGNGDCLSLTPSTSKAHMHKRCASAKLSTPLRVREGFSVVGNASIVVSIVGLRSRISPSTVLLEVPTICVDSVDTHSFRTFPHVIKEILEAFNPSVANSYANSAVVAIACVFGIAASFLHALPNTVRSRISEAMRCVSFYKNGRQNLAMKAPAGFTPAACKAKSSDNSLCFARALTQPEGATALDSVRYVGFGNYGPAPKRHTGKVFEFTHFRHLEKFTINRVWQAVVKPLFGSYPSHGFNYNRSGCC